mmetsp:Transcript_512/g.860  ORF Transcript_512/g.860 Transcript_512/m.860 type:complete len:117 (+) Transcript_512:206-556(+)|eukprot:CAMPEP_0184656694 /NCGR_PEP_ID=MMETSP0308-20130426/16687_1 /TAXON_ID=38269 /ORGANISM="Gloeochaete witrockiana, Strain SAG 46.84" /LENGTH=116 /DNA_ID=CAMNT_0027093931 /DNA_START=205 /DNA_END=555 /DNA_ORIENTATION=-
MQDTDVALTASFPARKKTNVAASKSKPSRAVTESGKVAKKNEKDVKQQSKTIVLEAEEDYELALRKFDLDMKYGPCAGISRTQRYNRAVELGMAPPEWIPEYIEKSGREKSIFGTL